MMSWHLPQTLHGLACPLLSGTLQIGKLSRLRPAARPVEAGSEFHLQADNAIERRPGMILDLEEEGFVLTTETTASAQ